MKLFFDTETTGKADLNRPPDDPCQPRLVSLAAILTTDDCHELASINLIIKPQGFDIPEDAARIHGITTKIASEAGAELMSALFVFSDLADVADSLHAFNLDFDQFVMQSEFMGAEWPVNFADWPNSECEMKAMTPICKLPAKFERPNRNGDFKWPNLQEAHQFAFGEKFDQAHDAMADCRALVRIHHWRLAHQSINNTQPTPP